MGTMVATTSFSFRGGREDIAHDAAEHMESTIEGSSEALEFVRMGAEPEETRGSGAGLGSGQIRGISVGVEDHVAGRVFDGGRGVSGCIVEEINTGISRGFGGMGLLGSNGVEGYQHGVVNGASVVEEHTNNFTNGCGGGSIKWRGGVEVSELDTGTILGQDMFVGGIRRFGVRDFEAFESPGHIAWHGKQDSAIDVIPVKVEAAEFISGPVKFDSVMFGKGGNEEIGIGFADILDTKVINDEGKHDGAGGVHKESGCVLSLDETGLGKFGNKLFIGKAAGLW